MARVNSQGYVEVSRGPTLSSGRKERSWKNWFFVKWVQNDRNTGRLKLDIILPERYVGKKVRLKVEEVEE